MKKSMPKVSRRRMSGISLVESMVALIVISVGMLGIAGLYLSSLQAGRSANLRSQAVNLASEMADRIRANREGELSYALAAGTLPSAVDCASAICTPAQLAQSDQNIWITSLRNNLPGGATSANGSIVVTDLKAAGEVVSLFQYRITVSWREAGSDIDYSYSLVVEV